MARVSAILVSRHAGSPYPRPIADAGPAPVTAERAALFFARHGAIFPDDMKFKKILQAFLMIVALLGFAAYTFLHNSDACLIAGS